MMGRPSAHRTVTWRRLGIGFCVLLSLVLVGAGTSSARASGSVHAAGTHAGVVTAGSSRCRQRNRATGTVTVGLGPQAPGGVNPLFLVVPLLAWDDMFRHDNRDRFVPMLATEVPTIANGGIKNGGKTIVIHLRRGLHWSNGAEITSADVRFFVQTANDPANDPVNNCGDLCTAVAGVTTPDRYTAVIHLKRVDPQWLNETEGSHGFVIPTVWAGAWNKDPHAAALKYQDPSFVPPRNGPYVAESFNNSEAVLRPMKFYTGLTCGGFLRRIIVRVYRSDVALAAAASSRNVDIMPGIDPSLPAVRSAVQSGVYKLHVDPKFEFEHLELNHDPTYRGKPNPLHDVRVRLALALVLDKISLIRSALGVSRKAAQSIVAWTPWINTPKLVQAYADKTITGQWDPIARRYIADTGGSKALADSRKLLSEAGWKQGFTLDFTTSDNQGRRAEEAAVARDWAGIGVHMTAHFVPPSAFLGDYDHGGILSRGAFQVTTLASGSTDSFGLSDSLQSGSIARNNAGHTGSNFSGVRDPLIERAFERAGSTFSHRTQQVSFAIIQGEINRKAHWIPLYFRTATWAEDGRVENLSWNASEFTPLWNPSAWKLRTP